MTSTPRCCSRSAGFVLLALACLLVGVNVATADLDDGLVGYWSFDEGEGGTAYDYSGHGSHGAIHGASWVDAVSGTGLSFDGADDYIQVPHSVSLQPQSGITIAAWVKPNGFYVGPCQGNYIVSKGVDNTVGWYGLVYADFDDCGVFTPEAERFYIAMRFADETVSGSVSNTVVQLQRWCHVVGTYDGASCRIYVDGVQEAVAVFAKVLGANTQDLTIGRMMHASYPYWVNGIIDEVRIYNRALGDSEILDLYWSTTHPDPQEDTTEGEQGEVSGTSSDPVNTATGSFFHQETDLTISSRGSPIQFTRFYNSRAAAPGRKAGKSGKAVATGRVTATSQPASPKAGEPSSVDAKKHAKSLPGKDQKQAAGSSQARPKMTEDSK